MRLMILLAIVAFTSFGIAAEYSSRSVDPLLYLSFICFGAIAQCTSILSMQAGVTLYPFDAVSRLRVISLLNALFDSGSITYLGLWALAHELNLSLTNVVFIYAVLAVICFSGGLYYWIILSVKLDPEMDYLDEHGDDTTKKLIVKERITYKPVTGLENDSSELITDKENNDPNIANSYNSCTDSNSLTITNYHTDGNYYTTNEYHDDNGIVKTNGCYYRNEYHDNDAVEKTSSLSYIKIADRRPYTKQILSEPFILLCYFFSMHFVNNSYTLTAMRDFLAYLGDDEYNNRYLTIFTMLLPISISGIPFVDYIIRNYGYHVGFQTINVLSLSQNCIKLFSTNLNVQIIGFVLFTFLRCFLFCMTLSYVPILVHPKVTGRCIGIMMFACGLMSFINLPLSNLGMLTYDGNFFVPNTIATMLTLPCFIVAYRMGTYMDKEKKASLNNY